MSDMTSPTVNHDPVDVPVLKEQSTSPSVEAARYDVLYQFILDAILTVILLNLVHKTLILNSRGQTVASASG